MNALSKIIKHSVLAAILLAAICLLYGFFIEPNRLVRRDVIIESSSYEGPEIKILLVSDLHFGGHWMNAKRAKKMFQALAKEDVNYILMPGDFISGHDSISAVSEKKQVDITDSFKSLKDQEFSVPLIASLGNHDSWYGKSTVRDELMRSGVTVLDNAAFNIDNICFVGLADFDTDRPDIDAAETCEEGQVVIVLSHSPDAMSFAPPNTDLIVTGHTHGGQINLPIIVRKVTATHSGEPYAYGLKYYNGVPVFITAGVGTSILPARFRAQPEYVIITLR